MEKPNIYDFILTAFTDDYNQLRPQLNKPGIIDDYVYATDAHVCIRLPKKLCNLDYTNNAKFPKADQIYPSPYELERFNKIKVSSQDLLMDLFSCELHFLIYENECKKCDGNGETECEHCHNDGECKSCKGTGTIDEIKPFSKLTIYGNDVIFHGKKYNPRFLYAIVQSAILLKADSIEYLYNESQKGIFKFSELEILVMTKFNK